MHAHASLTCCTDRLLLLMNSRHARRASCGLMSTSSAATSGQLVVEARSSTAVPAAVVGERVGVSVDLGAGW